MFDCLFFFFWFEEKQERGALLQIEKFEERRKWLAYWQDKVFAISQQLGLEIIRPHYVGAEKDVALATLGQSYVFLESDGLVNVQATYDKIDLVSFRVTV